MSDGPSRVFAVDWLRGAAVLVMIQCHAMVLLLPELRTTAFAAQLYRLDGLVAPSFILAAGFSLGLTLVRAAAQGTLQARVRKTSRRVLEVFVVAYIGTVMFGALYHPWRFVRMDILHCIAISLVVCLVLGAALAHKPWALIAVASLLGAAVFAVSPFTEGVRGFWSHFANTTSDSLFPLFPWIAYALLGLGLGALTADKGVGALALACAFFVGLGLLMNAVRPSIVAAYPPHNEWVTSPAEAGVRLGKVMFATLTLMAIERWVRGAEKMPPLRLLAFFGTSSLGGYFFHEALLFYPVFGACFACYFRDSQGWPGYWALTALLIACTSAVVLGWNWLWEWLLKKLAAFRGSGPRTSTRPA